MFSGNFPEECLRSHGKYLIVLLFPWKERIISSPPPKTNMLLISARTVAKRRHQHGELRAGARGGMAHPSWEHQRAAVRVVQWGPRRCTGNQVMRSKATPLPYGTCVSLAEEGSVDDLRRGVDTKTPLTDNLGPRTESQRIRGCSSA